MKRLLLLFTAAILWCVASNAETLPNTMTFQGDDVTVICCADGSCVIVSPETGRITGTYNMSREINPGDSRVTVYFYTNLDTFKGEFFWPAQDGLMLNFENIILRKRG